MDKRILEMIEKELQNVLDEFKLDLTNPCSKLSSLTKINKIYNRYISSEELESFIKDKFPTKYRILQTKHSKFFLYILYHFCKHKMDIKLVLHVLGMVFFEVLRNKYIKFCDSNTANIAIQNLKATHLYRTHGFPDMLNHIATTVTAKFSNLLQNCDDETIYILIIFRLRTSISQSLKSFVNTYLKIKKEMKNKRNNDTSSIEDHIFQTIMVYGYIPKIDSCSDFIYNKMKKLPYMDQYLVKDSIHEIISTVYTIGKETTYQRIIQQFKIGSFQITTKLLKQLGIPINTTNILCFIRTLLKSIT